MKEVGKHSIGIIESSHTWEFLGAKAEHASLIMEKDVVTLERSPQMAGKTKRGLVRQKSVCEELDEDDTGKEVGRNDDDRFPLQRLSASSSVNAAHLRNGKLKMFAMKPWITLRGKSFDAACEGRDAANSSIKRRDLKFVRSKTMQEPDLEGYELAFRETDYTVRSHEARRLAICDEIERVLEERGSPLRTQRRNLIVADNLLKWHLL